MKKIAVVAAAVAVGIVVPAQAAKPPKQPTPPKTPVTCKANKEGFRASGTLVGINSTTMMITVNVKKANHHAPTGNQTYSLSTAKVKYHGVSSTAPPVGSRVKLSGTVMITHKKGCPNPMPITLKKVDINKAPKK